MLNKIIFCKSVIGFVMTISTVYLLKDIYKHEFLNGACARAMTQIHDRRYSEYLRNEGRNDIWAYGIAFFKKRCKVVAEKLK